MRNLNKPEPKFVDEFLALVNESIDIENTTAERKLNMYVWALQLQNAPCLKFPDEEPYHFLKPCLTVAVYHYVQLGERLKGPVGATDFVGDLVYWTKNQNDLQFMPTHEVLSFSYLEEQDMMWAIADPKLIQTQMISEHMKGAIVNLHETFTIPDGTKLWGTPNREEASLALKNKKFQAWTVPKKEQPKGVEKEDL